MISGMDPGDELAAQYALARTDKPDASPEEIVALVTERLSIYSKTNLAAESLAAGGDVDAIRQFVYEMELEGELEDD
jgi:hypothetical protein